MSVSVVKKEFGLIIDWASGQHNGATQFLGKLLKNTPVLYG
ncbi:hypothetical protein [Carboxylicivirga litoralis]|nr:hypothetical protein [Carboxylicivirga sp. A043]